MQGMKRKKVEKVIRHVWRNHWISVVVLVGFLAALTSACTPDPTEEPPVAPPVNTLPPPLFTQTALFTATLTPSLTPTVTETYTPSATPTPQTPTLTPTLTPTPPIRGEIISDEENVRIRTGPGRDFEQVATVPRGTLIDVIGSERNRIRETWYFIRITTEEGEIIEGWIWGQLVEVSPDSSPIPTLGAPPSATPTITPTGSPPATLSDGTTLGTPGPAATLVEVPTSALATPLAQLSNVNILAYCQQDGIRPPAVRSDQTVSIFWRWWVTRPELMQSHLDYASYEVRLDGEVLVGWEQFRDEMRRDPNNNDYWTTYWYYPVGQLEPGQHRVEFRLTWSNIHNDGLEDYGPGTENEEETGDCTFTVVEAGN